MAGACPTCGETLGPVGSPCPQCGAGTTGAAREWVQRVARQAREKRRRGVRALRVLLYGSLGLAAGLSALDAGLPENVLQSGAQHCLVAALALAGVIALGPGGFRSSLGDPLRLRDVPLTFAVGVVGGILKWAFTLLLLHTLGSLAYGAPRELSPSFFLSSVIAVVLQEWLYRGVTFEAARRLMSPRAAVLVTAAQFALVYGLAFRPFSVPSHFLWGLLLGWIRLRTGSVLASALAHAVGRAITLVAPY